MYNIFPWGRNQFFVRLPFLTRFFPGRFPLPLPLLDKQNHEILDRLVLKSSTRLRMGRRVLRIRRHLHITLSVGRHYHPGGCPLLSPTCFSDRHSAALAMGYDIKNKVV